MKKSRFTEEQIVFALTQTELGTPVPEVCRDFTLRAEAHAAAGRGKPTAEEAGCRSEPRQGDAAIVTVMKHQFICPPSL